jgi:hypothetical protein
MEPQQQPQPTPNQNSVPEQPQPTPTPPVTPQVQPQPTPQQPMGVPPAPLTQAPINPTVPQPGYPLMPPPSTKKSRIVLKVLGGIIILAVVFLIIGIFVLNQSTKDAEVVSNKFLADIQSNNASAAYGLTTPTFQKIESESKLADLFSQISPDLKGSDSVVGKAVYKTSGSPDEAVLVYKVKISTGTNYIRFVLLDNKPWQVLNFRASSTLLNTAQDSD